MGSTHTCPYGNIRTDSTHAEEPYLGILASGRTDFYRLEKWAGKNLMKFQHR